MSFQSHAIKAIPVWILVLAATYFFLLIYTYFFTEYYPGDGAVTFYTVLVYLLVAWFVELDSKSQGKKIYRVYEHGLLVYYSWPVYVPYYFLKTRGWRGLMILVCLGLLLLLDWIAYGLFYVFY